MNFTNKTIKIDYPIEAVQMNYLSSDQALVFGALKANGVLYKHDLLKGLGVTPLKLEKILGLLLALEKCTVDGDKVYFLESIPAAQVVSAAAAATPTVSLPSLAEPVKVEEKAEPLPFNLNRPNNVQEVYNHLTTHFNTANFHKLNSPDTDMHATAEKFFDFYAAKDWMIGSNPVKNWPLLLRRAVNDNGGAWAVVKKDLMSLARQADELRVQQSTTAPQQQAMEQLPAPVMNQAPRVEQERDQFLKGKVAEKLGPRPILANFVQGQGTYCTPQEREAWMQACIKYDEAFARELQVMSSATDSIPTNELYDLPF